VLIVFLADYASSNPSQFIQIWDQAGWVGFNPSSTVLATTTNAHLRYVNTSGSTQDVYIRGNISSGGGIGRIIVMKFGEDFDGAYSSLTGLPTIPTNNNQLTNGAGYLTSISSGNVTTALGYTPVNNAGDVMTGALDMGSNNITTTGKVLFANVYNNVGDLPSASTYHGMFAHVHGTGAGYFAHAGQWIRLANHSDLGSGGSSFVSMGYATGGGSSSSTSYRFSGAISLPAGHTITGWSSDQTNMAITWRDNYQGSPTILGTGSYTNSGGSAVNVYAWCNTSNSNARSVTYQIFG